MKIFTQGGCHGSITGPNDRGDDAAKLFCCNTKDLPLRGDAAGEILWQSAGSTQEGRYFYNETLGWDENKLFIPPRRKSSPLAEVFSPEEIVRLIRAARGLKQRVLLMTAYSAGLRVSELVNLKITDIDPARMTLRVRQGKGGKDRYAILSQNLLVELRVYWKRYRPAIWLFPNRAKNGPLSRGEAWHIFRSAKRRAGLKKGRGLHSLRACFATHLLEAGVDLRSIQFLMGHTSLLSTQRYLRLRPQNVDRTVSPLDRLPLTTV